MKITYYVQRYRPEYEAISKEVKMLSGHFAKNHTVKIHDLHLDGLFQGQKNEKIISYHFLFYPGLFPYTKILSAKSDLNHIYTSLGDLPYLQVIDLQNTILTAAASCSLNRIKRRVRLLRQLPYIVTETEFHQKLLKELGINPRKIKLIYPPVDVSSFSYLPAAGTFKILNASCPTRKEDFGKRGIGLLIDFAQQNKSEVILNWRKGAGKEIRNLLSEKKMTNITLKNGIVKDMNQEYAQVQATIIPYTQFDDFLKLIPNSALESLAAGKPLLVSTKTELAKIVQEQKCGVVFEPTTESLGKAVEELKKRYPSYQRNCRRTAEKLFSKEIFLQKYEDLYQKLAAPKL